MICFIDSDVIIGISMVINNNINIIVHYHLIFTIVVVSHPCVIVISIVISIYFSSLAAVGNKKEHEGKCKR